MSFRVFTSLWIVFFVSAFLAKTCGLTTIGNVLFAIALFFSGSAFGWNYRGSDGTYKQN